MNKWGQCDHVCVRIPGERKNPFSIAEILKSAKQIQISTWRTPRVGRVGVAIQPVAVFGGNCWNNENPNQQNGKKKEQTEMLHFRALFCTILDRKREFEKNKSLKLLMKQWRQTTLWCFWCKFGLFILQALFSTFTSKTAFWKRNQFSPQLASTSVIHHTLHVTESTERLVLTTNDHSGKHENTKTTQL